MKWTAGASVAAATVVVLLLGGIFRDSSSATTSADRRAGGRDRAVPGRLLGRGQRHGSNRRASSRPSCAPTRTMCTSLDALGLAYQQRARETGDPAYYTKSEQALNRALRLAPRDLVATSGLGSLALSRHRFAEALVLGRKAHADLADDGAQLRHHRRRPRRARPLSRGIRGVRHDGDAATRPLLVRARLARPRAARTRARGDRDDEARRPGGCRRRASPRPGRASSSASSTGRSVASLPPSARTAPPCGSSPATTTRSTRSRGSRRRRATIAPRSRSSSRPSTGFRCRSTLRSSVTSTASTGSRRRRASSTR